MLNEIIIIGRMTADPELRRTPNGVAVTSFTLAVDRDLRNKETGEKETDFIDVITWRGSAEFVAKYMRKGDLLAAKGRLQIRNWTDKEGNKRRTAEVNAEKVYKMNYSTDAGADASGKDYDVILGDDAELPFL